LKDWAVRHSRHHYGLALAGLLALIAFAFGKNIAVRVVQGIFVLAFCGVVLIGLDIANAMLNR
jgi:branched-subunit amino acid transport protein